MALAGDSLRSKGVRVSGADALVKIYYSAHKHIGYSNKYLCPVFFLFHRVLGYRIGSRLSIIYFRSPFDYGTIVKVVIV